MSSTSKIITHTVAAQTVRRVAASLERRGDSTRASELMAIAQFLGNDATSLSGYDPSQEVMPMGGPERRDGEHHLIQPFAKQNSPSPINSTMVHTVSMTLTAPPEITETDMLNYILGMRDKLGVDATNVQWSKKEQTIKATVN